MGGARRAAGSPGLRLSPRFRLACPLPPPEAVAAGRPVLAGRRTARRQDRALLTLLHLLPASAAARKGTPFAFRAGRRRGEAGHDPALVVRNAATPGPAASAGRQPRDRRREGRAA